MQNTNSDTIFSVLYTCTNDLKTQNKQAAIVNIQNISSEIKFFESASTKKATDYENKQKKLTLELSQIIKREVEIRNSYLEMQNKIDEVNIELKKDQVEIDSLSNSIQSLNESIHELENDMKIHQEKMDRLNDSSALGILSTISSFGMDRLMLATEILINGDVEKINNAKEEISIYQALIQSKEVQFLKFDTMFKDLSMQRDCFQSCFDASKKKEVYLQHVEKDVRKRLTFFTEISLFYGKLSILSRDVESRIEDVFDIIGELNNETPTIVDFDSSEANLISLKQSLKKFDILLSNEPVG